MKKNMIVLLIAMMMTVSVSAQPAGKDLRTTETKVADLLMKLPATNSADLQNLMEELASYGEPAITALASNLVAPGKGNDAASRYAISGLAIFAAREGGKLAETSSRALSEAISRATDAEVKDFLLQELQFVADDNAIPVVSKLLTDKRLSDPAVRVLIRIGSESAAKALAAALPGATTAQQANVVTALGDLRYAPAAAALRNLAATPDPLLKKVVLRALAEIGDPSSEQLLAAEAQKSGFSFEPVDAMGSYLLFLKRTAENGNPALVERTTQKMIKNKSLPEYARTAALETLASAIGAKAIPVLMKSLKSSDKVFRMTAQRWLSEVADRATLDKIVKMASKTKSGALQSELITMLGDRKEKAALPLMFKLMKSTDQEVKAAAIVSAARTGQEEAITPLADLLKEGDKTILPLVINALQTIPGKGVSQTAALLIPQVKGATRSALIGLLARRNATEYSDLIFAEAQSEDPQVKLAAAKALTAVAGQKDAAAIAGLLNKASSNEEISALQEALYTATLTGKDKAAQTAAILGLMKKAGSQESTYYNVLSRIGGSEALAVVEKEFKTSTASQKEAALKALSGWSDFSALDVLYRISKNDLVEKFRETALNSFIAGINKSDKSPEQKVLMFRNAMELAQKPDQKKQILDGISRNSTFQSLIFAGSFLEDPELEQSAVQAVNSIYQKSTRLYGTTVKKIVEKAIALNKDAEADYQKQAVLKHMASLPVTEGFVPLFNGQDLTGWKGLVGNPISRSKMKPNELKEAQQKADQEAAVSWVAENGTLLFTGKGDNLCTVKDYADFEMTVDWKLYPGKEPDAGVYLRGTPQVQIWDTARVNVGAQVGSGGLYNNQKNPSKPLVVADNAVDEWNTFHIRMVDDKVTVYLNGKLVVNNVILENYWDRSQPIFPSGAIEMQAHGSKVAYRDIYVREIPRPEPYKVSANEEKEGFVPLFNGISMDGWSGNTIDYFAQEGMIVCQPTGRGKGNLYTDKEYGDFIMRFDFQLTPGANNGLGIRTPKEGDAAYVGMELQILDNEAEIYRNLKEYQYHGSVYGVIPSKRGFLKPVGEWNTQEVQAIGNKIKVTLNGEVILDGDIAVASKNNTATVDKIKHPGLLNKSGFIGFLGHGSPLKFRNLRIRDISGN